jgi:hypothetical protein
MIAALINDETIAINTAKPSALKTKLKPKGRFIVTFIIRPERIADKIKTESKNDEKTKRNAVKFLNFIETLLTKGRKAAPISGRKTTKVNATSLFI